MKGIKKISAIILCAILIFASIPIAAIAVDEAYVDIKFVNDENANITFGETQEVYIEYSAGEYENYEIEWEISTAYRLKTKYIKDEQTGHITRAKITGANLGGYSVTVKILDENGNEITSAKKYFTVVESKNKSLEEKIYVFFRDANFLAFFTTGFIALPIVTTPIMAPYYLYLVVKNLIEKVF